MDRNDDERIKALLEDKKAEAKAHFMMLDLLSTLMPDEMKPAFELPKLCHKAVEKISEVMDVMKSYDNFDDGTKYATEACTFIARVNEAVEAFIEQNSPSKSKELSDFDQM